MPESFALVRWLNALFMGIEAKAFQSIGIQPTEAAQQAVKVNQAFGLELLVAAGLIAFFVVVRMTLAVEKPNPAQQIAEMVHEFTGSQAATSASRLLLPASSSLFYSIICWG